MGSEIFMAGSNTEFVQSEQRNGVTSTDGKTHLSRLADMKAAGIGNSNGSGHPTKSTVALCGFPVNCRFSIVPREYAEMMLKRGYSAHCITCAELAMARSYDPRFYICRHCGCSYRTNGRKRSCRKCIQRRATYRARIVQELEARGGLLAQEGENERNAQRPRSDRRIDLTGHKF